MKGEPKASHPNLSWTQCVGVHCLTVASPEEIRTWREGGREGCAGRTRASTTHVKMLVFARAFIWFLGLLCSFPLKQEQATHREEHKGQICLSWYEWGIQTHMYCTAVSNWQTGGKRNPVRPVPHSRGGGGWRWTHTVLCSEYPSAEQEKSNCCDSDHEISRTLSGVKCNEL